MATKPRRAQLRTLARLLFCPWTLADAAIATTTDMAALAATLALLIEVGMPVGLCVGVSEPFRDLTDFYCYVLYAATPVTLLTLLPFGALVCLSYLAIRRGPSARRAAQFRLLLLGPTVVIVPMAIWWFCASIEEVARPNFGLYGYKEGKPAWFSSPLIVFLARLRWWFVLVGVALLNTCAATRWLARKHIDVGFPQCQSCDYNLTGNVSGICPECGTTCQVQGATE